MEFLSKFMPFFCSNLCGEKFSPKVRLWRKNDKYEVCDIQVNVIDNKRLFVVQSRAELREGGERQVE